MWSGNKKITSSFKRHPLVKNVALKANFQDFQLWPLNPKHGPLSIWNNCLSGEWLSEQEDQRLTYSHHTNIMKPNQVSSGRETWAPIWSLFEAVEEDPLSSLFPHPKRFKYTHINTGIHTHTHKHTHTHTQLESLLPHLGTDLYLQPARQGHTCLPASPIHSILREDMEQSKSEHIGENCRKIWLGSPGEKWKPNKTFG